MYVRLQNATASFALAEQKKKRVWATSTLLLRLQNYRSHDFFFHGSAYMWFELHVETFWSYKTIDLTIFTFDMIKIYKKTFIRETKLVLKACDKNNCVLEFILCPKTFWDLQVHRRKKSDKPIRCPFVFKSLPESSKCLNVPSRSEQVQFDHWENKAHCRWTALSLHTLSHSS